MAPEHIQAEWEKARAWLLPAIEHGLECTEEEVVKALHADEAQLYRGKRAALVTQLVRKEGLSVAVWLGGGDLAEIMELRPGIEAWARWQGAQFAWIHGRPGWSRALKHFGYVERDGELVKPLQGGDD